MKIVVINGTSYKGVTNYIKDLFIKRFKSDDIIEFYPNDMPSFCLGCKNCFLKGEELCPHANKVMPIWEAMLNSDLIVFSYPVYALRAPASIKSLLDHLCVHWMVHRPDKKMFSKTAVILTNSVGAPNESAQEDVKTSLSWMGVSKIHTCGMGMMGDIIIDKLSEKHKATLESKTLNMYNKVKSIKPYKGMSLIVKGKFAICKKLHSMILKGETTPSLDNQHYINNGWIRRK